MKPPSEFEKFTQDPHIQSHLKGVSYQILAFSLIPVMASGGCSFAILAPPYFLDRTTAICYSVLGIIGTLVTAIILAIICSKGPKWRAGELGRNSLIFLVTIAWVIGAITGYFYFYVIPGQSVS